MIDQTTLITYLIVLLGFVFIPGPATLLTLARASASGTKNGLATAFGIAVGDLVHTAMTVLGLSVIIMASATAFTIIKYAGAAYLVYLGLKAIFDRSAGFGVPSVKVLTSGAAFRQAVLAEVLNPKSALFFLSFLPQFVNPANGAVGVQLTILGVLFVLLGLLSTVTVAFAAGYVGAFLRRNQTIARWQGKAVGAIYCALGIRLALQDR